MKLVFCWNFHMISLIVENSEFLLVVGFCSHDGAAAGILDNVFFGLSIEKIGFASPAIHWLGRSSGHFVRLAGKMGERLVQLSG
jgi:hypothetical protein